MEKFKNDRERIAFLEDYRNTEREWYLWKEDDDLDRRWWRYDLPESALIVEEQKRIHTWPDKHIAWDVIHWYIITDQSGNTPFGDQVASRTMALTYIKKLEKEA